MGKKSCQSICSSSLVRAAPPLRLARPARAECSSSTRLPFGSRLLEYAEPIPAHFGAPAALNCESCVGTTIAWRARLCLRHPSEEVQFIGPNCRAAARGPAAFPLSDSTVRLAVFVINYETDPVHIAGNKPDSGDTVDHLRHICGRTTASPGSTAVTLHHPPHPRQAVPRHAWRLDPPALQDARCAAGRHTPIRPGKRHWLPRFHPERQSLGQPRTF